MILSEARGIKETLGEIKQSTNSNIPILQETLKCQVSCMSHCAYQPPCDSDKVLQDDFGMQVLYQQLVQWRRCTYVLKLAELQLRGP